MWRFATSIFRSSVEKFALLCLVVLVTCIVVSIWMYEDTTGPDAESIRQQHQYRLEEMLREEELLVRRFQLEKLKRSQMEDHILGTSTNLPTTDRLVKFLSLSLYSILYPLQYYTIPPQHHKNPLEPLESYLIPCIVHDWPIFS